MGDDRYRMHRVRAGEERVLTTLARGNARFGDGSGGADDWQPPLGGDEAARFVADPRTVLVVALDARSNTIAGFVYGCVLYRRHTKLEHLCVYELGVDIDHRRTDVGRRLMEAIAGEARQMGITRGFVITAESDTAARRTFEGFGAVRSPETDILYGLSF